MSSVAPDPGPVKPPRKTRNGVLITCADCGRPSIHAAHGLCYSCYRRARGGYHPPVGQCADCGRRQPIVAHGLCRACYGRAWRDRRRAAAPP